MYYNRFLGKWTIDLVDYLLIGALIGSLFAQHLRKELEEKEAMERLKKSILSKSRLLTPETSSSKSKKIQKIYRFALTTPNRGGQLKNFQADHEFSNEVFKLAQDIKGLVEQLARFLKEREFKGFAPIFFKSGRLLLELILYKCRMTITYSWLTQGLSTQVSIITATAGGAVGFTLSWFSTGASLVAPPVLIHVLLLRNLAQQILHQSDYVKFKSLLNPIFEDDERKQTIRAIFVDDEVPRADRIEMKLLDSDPNTVPKFDFDVQSDQTPEEFLKARMEEELGLVENPTQEQLEEITHRKKIHRKPKGKTVYFKDLIDKIAEGSDDILDAEIVKEPIRVKRKNEEL